MSRVPCKPIPRFKLGQHVFFSTDIGVGEGTVSAITYSDLGNGMQVCDYWVNGSERQFTDEVGVEDGIYETWAEAWKDRDA